MLYLKELNIEDSKKEYDFFKNIRSENGFENEYANISYDEFINTVIPERINASQGIHLKSGYVPSTYYFLWEDATIVGIYKIRHYLNDFLRTGPGHIGYGILPSFRNKGYGSKGLALAIEKCKEILSKEETEVYLSCWLRNEASLRIQLKNNAYIDHKDDSGYYTRIKIR